MITAASALYPVKASIVVLAWKNAAHLPACFASLHRHIRLETSHEIVVVLNGAATDVARIVEETPGIRVVHSGRNVGFAGGCHLGARAASGEYLVFLNDDTIIEPRWLEALIETADAHPNAAAVGSQILYPDGSLQEAGSVIFSDGSTTAVGRLAGLHPATFDFLRRVDYCSACSLLVRRTVWDEVGGFHEEYFPAYYEDTDLCLTAAARGYTVLYDPRSRVRHVESASSSPGDKVFLLLRSREEFHRRWTDALPDFESARPLCSATIARAIWRARGLPPRVLVVDDRLTPPALGSGIGRLRDLITALAPSHAVTFSPTDPSFDVDSDWLRAQGVGLVECRLEDYLSRPEVLFDVAILSRPNNFEQWAGVIRRHQPQAAVVYDAEALYWRRLERQARLAADVERQATLRNEFRRFAAIERGIARAADAVVAVSPCEARWFRRHRPRDGVFCAPPIRATGIRPSPGFDTRRDLLLVAGWLGGADSPNRDGLQWFLDEVAPRIRLRLPDVRLKVTGEAFQAGEAAIGSGLVDFAGIVPDLGPLYDAARVVVAPVRYGAGVKIKVIEAIEHGVPVVTTSVGIEGIRGGERAAAVADNPERFAHAVVALAVDPAAWTMRRNAIAALARTWAERRDPDWPAIVAHARRRMTPEVIRRRAAR